MKIPVYEEIILHNFEKKFLLEVLKRTKIGKLPTFINLKNYTAEETYTILDNIDDALLALNIHPLFPYPFYAITDKISRHNRIPVAKDSKELPEHFYKKVKRPNNKEQQVLNKLQVKVERLANLDINQSIKMLQLNKDEQQLLFDECKELYYLEKMNKRLNKKS